MVSCGAFTGTSTVPVQCVAAGQVGSPPPDAVALLLTVVPLAAAAGVTGIVKLVPAPTARPAGIVQVTLCPLAVQPAGKVPSVRLAGTVSLMVATAVVAAVPLLVTVNV